MALNKPYLSLGIFILILWCMAIGSIGSQNWGSIDISNDAGGWKTSIVVGLTQETFDVTVSSTGVSRSKTLQFSDSDCSKHPVCSEDAKAGKAALGVGAMGVVWLSFAFIAAVVLVLKADSQASFVPMLALALGILMSLASLFLLIATIAQGAMKASSSDVQSALEKDPNLSGTVKISLGYGPSWVVCLVTGFLCVASCVAAFYQRKQQTYQSV